MCLNVFIRQVSPRYFHLLCKIKLIIKCSERDAAEVCQKPYKSRKLIWCIKDVKTQKKVAALFGGHRIGQSPRNQRRYRPIICVASLLRTYNVNLSQRLPLGYNFIMNFSSAHLMANQ